MLHSCLRIRPSLNKHPGKKAKPDGQALSIVDAWRLTRLIIPSMSPYNYCRTWEGQPSLSPPGKVVDDLCLLQHRIYLYCDGPHALSCQVVILNVLLLASTVSNLAQETWLCTSYHDDRQSTDRCDLCLAILLGAC